MKLSSFYEHSMAIPFSVGNPGKTLQFILTKLINDLKLVRGLTAVAYLESGVYSNGQFIHQTNHG